MEGEGKGVREVGNVEKREEIGKVRDGLGRRGRGEDEGGKRREEDRMIREKGRGRREGIIEEGRGSQCSVQGAFK